MRHEDLGSGAVWDHDAGYAIASCRTGRLRPYGGFDRHDFASGDPFFAPNDTDLTRAIAGVRFEIDDFNAVKLEYRHNQRPQEKSDGLLVQTAFSF